MTPISHIFQFAANKRTKISKFHSVESCISSRCPNPKIALCRKQESSFWSYVSQSYISINVSRYPMAITCYPIIFRLGFPRAPQRNFQNFLWSGFSRKIIKICMVRIFTRPRKIFKSFLSIEKIENFS